LTRLTSGSWEVCKSWKNGKVKSNSRKVVTFLFGRC
jgi:hypothetical protein